MKVGIMDVLKIRKAVTKQQKGDIQGALEDYEALYGAGVVNVTYMLPYAVILLKKGGEENYLKVKEILRKAEKAPNMTPEYRQQLLMDYAVANYKLGEMDKALQLLEATHKKAPCGLTYQSLGFLYIQAGDAEKADFAPSAGFSGKTGFRDGISGAAGWLPVLRLFRRWAEIPVYSFLSYRFHLSNIRNLLFLQDSDILYYNEKASGSQVPARLPFAPGPYIITDETVLRFTRE